MGFINFAHFVELCRSEGSPVDKEIPLDWKDVEGNRPWLIIDWNNVTMKLAAEQGCDMAALSLRYQAMFTALFSCGARLCILKDGDHDLDRLIVKFDRAINDLEDNIDTGGPRSVKPLNSSRMAISLANQLAKSTLLSLHPIMSSDAFSITPETTCIFQEVHGEADGAIRQFASQRLAEGNDVYLLSDDHSLLLGLAPAQLVFLRPSSLAIKQCPESQESKLFGTSVLIQDFLSALTKRCNKICEAPVNKKLYNHIPISSDMLPYISSIFSGDMRKFRGRCYDDPIRLTWFLNVFFNLNSNQHKGAVVISAAILVRAWFEAPNISRDSFLSCIVEVVRAAHRAMGGHQLPSIFGLYSPNRDAKAIADAASSLLFIFENHVSKDRIQGTFKKDSNVLTSFRHQPNRFPGRIVYLNRDNTAGVLFGDPGLASDYAPCALANADVQKAMAWQVDRAVQEIDFHSGAPSEGQTYWMVWGFWTNYEPRDVLTEVQLSPLFSLARQVHYMQNLSPAVRQFLSVKDNRDELMRIYGEKLSPSNAEHGSIEDIHLFFSTLHGFLLERDLVSRRNGRQVKIARTKAPTSAVQLTYQLHDTHVKDPANHPVLAEKGAFASKYGGEVLEWQTWSENDGWAMDSGHCLPSVHYAGAEQGPFLNLADRLKHFKDKLKLFDRQEGNTLPSSHTSSLMDLFFSSVSNEKRKAIEEVLESMATLFERLPRSADAKAFLYATLSSRELAELSLMALYCLFKLKVLAPVSAIPAICAVLLSPVYASKSFDAIHSGAWSIKENQYDFEKSLREFHRNLFLSAGNKQSDRNANLLELVFYALLLMSFHHEETAHARFFHLTGIQSILGKLETCVGNVQKECADVLESLEIKEEDSKVFVQVVGKVFGLLRSLVAA